MSVDHNLPVGDDTPSSAESMEVEKPATQQEPVAPPEPPIRPTATRRSAIDNVQIPVNDVLSEVAKQRARVAITNIKLVRDVDPTVANAPLPNPKKDKSRRAAVDMEDAFRKVKRARLIGDEVAGPFDPNRPATKLTEDGAKESVKAGMADFTSDSARRKFEKPFGQQMGQASALPGEVHAINPGFKSGENTLQMLGHLSGLFMSTQKDLEYQSMLVNDRIFVAANKAAAITTFRGKTLRDLTEKATKNIVSLTADSKEVRPYLIGALSEALKLPATSTLQPTKQQLDGAAILAEHEIGHHVDHDARPGIRSMLNFLQHQALNSQTMVGPVSIDTAKDYVADPKYKNSVILVEPSHATGWHAEQTLVMVLISAKWRTGAMVGGTKLPCLSCWHTLNLLPQHGYPLSLVQTPGLFWSVNTIKGITQVAKALGITTVSDLEACLIKTQKYTGDGFREYMTAVEEQGDLTVEVKRGGGLARLGLTQDQSQRSFYLAQRDPHPVELTGAPYADQAPASPRGYYGTPPNSPGANLEDEELAGYDEKMSEYKAKLAEFEKLTKANEERKDQPKDDATSS